MTCFAPSCLMPSRKLYRVTNGKYQLLMTAEILLVIVVDAWLSSGI